MNPPNVDYIYWTFTAAAQSVAAFVGLLLAGYALVHSFMESARERDESLDDIHAVLRRRYHRGLTALAVLTSIAIIASLVLVFCNRWEFPGKSLMVGLIGLVDLASLVFGLGFVVATTNPARYRITAGKVLAEREPELKLSGETVPVGKFFVLTARLEHLMRRIAQNAELATDTPPGGRTASFRQLADLLVQNERIDTDLHQRLTTIGQYRNLVYHGRVSTADKAMVDRVLAVIRRLERQLKPEVAAGHAEHRSRAGHGAAGKTAVPGEEA